MAAGRFQFFCLVACLSLVPSVKPHLSPKVNNMVYFVYTSDVQMTGPDQHKRDKRQVSETDAASPKITELTVSSDISSRFGTVVIDSTISNSLPYDTEATLEVILPEEAFMSNFTMLIGGELYRAEVVSKEEAEKRYKQAQERNVSAGLIQNDMWNPKEVVRGMELFQVSINIGANSTVQFTLTYLELLRRRAGLYEQKISIRPNQVIDKLSISIHLFEQQGIKEWQIIEPYGSNSLETLDTRVYERLEENMLDVNFMPSTDRQKEMSTEKIIGLYGDFILRYDVIHDDPAGLTQVANGFFVHYFSPSEYKHVLPKNVIFVIDISGSMSGIKIQKVRETMPVILQQLNEDDKFMLLLFDDSQYSWPDSAHLVHANSINIKAAKDYASENIHARGGTNINDALITAAKAFSAAQYGSNMIVFLTDGDPTAGVVNPSEILSNIHLATNGTISIFSLGYGFQLNFDFLQAISYRNNGKAQRIYNDIDADVQLRSFFSEIGSPVLYDIKLVFPAGIISAVTQYHFPQFFNGSEIVIAGQLNEVPDEWEFTINAVSDSPITMTKHVVSNDAIKVPPGSGDTFQPTFIERLYVYLKIKDYLRLSVMTDDEQQQDQYDSMALKMALDYHLVTPVTSFLIVEGEQTDIKQEDIFLSMSPSISSTSGSSPSSISTVAWIMNLSMVLSYCFMI